MAVVEIALELCPSGRRRSSSLLLRKKRIVADTVLKGSYRAVSSWRHGILMAAQRGVTKQREFARSHWFEACGVYNKE